jgi:hypothetical protein
LVGVDGVVWFVVGVVALVWVGTGLQLF